MKFEEALAALREGAKIRHPIFADDEYLMGCYVTLKTIFDDDGKELVDSFEDAKKRGMSIVRMKGDNPHSDMRPQLPIKKHLALLDEYPFLREKITFPTINLLTIMSDDWEILDVIK